MTKATGKENATKSAGSRKSRDRFMITLLKKHDDDVEKYSFEERLEQTNRAAVNNFLSSPVTLLPDNEDGKRQENLKREMRALIEDTDEYPSLYSGLTIYSILKDSCNELMQEMGYSINFNQMMTIFPFEYAVDQLDLIEDSISDLRQQTDNDTKHEKTYSIGMQEIKENCLAPAIPILYLMYSALDKSGYKKKGEYTEEKKKDLDSLKQFIVKHLEDQPEIRQGIIGSQQPYFDDFIEYVITATDKKKKQAAGRFDARSEREEAEKINAVMNIKDNKMIFFTNETLSDVFNYHLYRLGDCQPSDFDHNGRLINKEKSMQTAVNIAPQLHGLLTAIMGSTVENYQEELIMNGKIKFYCKGVAEAISDDFRTKSTKRENKADQQNRKIARRIYLEKQFATMLGIVGELPNHNIYSLFNYYGYEESSDTMTIESPLIYEMFIKTQQDRFARVESRKEKQEQRKRLAVDDTKPLEINKLFELGINKEDGEAAEIAVAITTSMILAGKGRNKMQQISYQTVINKCPTFKKQLDSIKDGSDGKPSETISQRYNTALRKFASACKLIMNEKLCSAKNLFSDISFEPCDDKNILLPPTSRSIHDKITIRWSYIPQADQDQGQEIQPATGRKSSKK